MVTTLAHFGELNSKESILTLDYRMDKLFYSEQNCLITCNQLAFPDITAATELVVDASGTHMGAILQQVKDDSCAPLAFWSKALTPAQLAWSTFDRELFACFAAIRYFNTTLMQKTSLFVLITNL